MFKKLSHIVLILISTVSTCLSQTPKNGLIGTKWGTEIPVGCIETYTFMEEGKFEYFNCEMEVTRTGEYFINQDTLTVMVYHIDDTPAFAGGIGKLNLRFQYDFLISKDALEMIYFKDYKFTSESKFNKIPYSRIIE